MAATPGLALGKKHNSGCAYVRVQSHLFYYLYIEVFIQGVIYSGVIYSRVIYSRGYLFRGYLFMGVFIHGGIYSGGIYSWVIYSGGVYSWVIYSELFIPGLFIHGTPVTLLDKALDMLFFMETGEILMHCNIAAPFARLCRTSTKRRLSKSYTAFCPV